ncbi:MAG: hypothetical protein NZ960_01220 [Candidatus Kapabacteria bacterium]|nr:hypothetical protein [Candidatus Kapabacteria bacterium]MDW8011648.1 hypothetical protein [Bacteroidota bacterium]
MNVVRGTPILAGLALVVAVEVGAHGWTRIRGQVEAAIPTAIVLSPRTGRLWMSADGALYTTPAVGAAWNSITTFPLTVSSVELASMGTLEVLLVTTPYGLWRSTDEGVTWMQVHPVLADRGTRIRIHPLYPNVVVGIRGQMAWQSRDAGALWEPIPLPQGTLYDLCPFGALNDILAWTSAGLFRSTDGGSSWQSVASSLPNEPVVDLATTGGVEPSICVVLPSGVYRSFDGTTWIATSLPGTTLRGIFASHAGVAAISRGALLVLRADNTWETVYSGYTDHITVLLPIAPGRVLVGSAIRGVELYQWSPYASWQAIRTGLDSPPILWAAQLGSAFVVGGPAGLFWSDTDATSLSNIALSLPRPHPLTAVGMYRSGVVVATSLGIYRYDHSTGRWQVLTEDLPIVGSLVSIAASPSGDTILALSDLGELLRSIDGGAAWEPPALNVRVASVIASGSSFLAFGADGIVQSTDAGSTWQPISSYPGGECYFLVSHPAAPQILLAASSLPNTRGGRLYRSTDGGQSWQTIGTADPLLRGLTALAAGASTAMWYAGTLEGEVFRSTDGGLSWHSLGTVGDGLPVYALLERPTQLLAGTPRGLWRSSPISAGLSLPATGTILRYAAGILTVDLPTEAAMELCLFTLSGELVGRWEHHSTVHLQLALPSIATGVYLATLRFSGGFHSQVLLVP